MLDHMRRFVELADIAARVRDSDTDWETKFEAIFCDDIAHALAETGIDFHYSSDSSYETDVIAFVAAVTDRAARIRPILAAIAPPPAGAEE
jgi:hypothetical protein